MTQLAEKKKPLIILTGPTAVGKTAASIGLAKAIGGEIISADSMQVYRHMDIGSAKIMPEEMDSVKHHLIDVLEPEAEFNVAVFQKMAKEAMGDVSDQVTEVKGVKLIAAKVDDVDMNGLRDLGDQLKEKLGEGVIVLASAAGGKVSLVAMATDEAVKKGAHAGNLIKGIAGLVGGGGGGRPNMAQAGGKNPDGIDAAIAKVSEVLESQL